MTASKYGNILTIILIVLVVAILVGIGLIVYNYAIKPNKDKAQSIEAIAEFDRNIENNASENTEQEENLELTPVENNTEQPKRTQIKRTYYQGHVMLGYISIPKTNVKEPILDKVTPETLNTAVAIIYPNNAQLNEPGNVVIVGHNYKNGTFFSNNKKLAVGDKIRIKDETGRELSYTIYEKFETAENDASFYDRDTNGEVEITLSTCTDDTKARIIILARADK